nr:PREDICTED: uncharacterized protein LOC109037081 [Bemisia tabaci]
MRRRTRRGNLAACLHPLVRRRGQVVVEPDTETRGHNSVPDTPPRLDPKPEPTFSFIKGFFINQRFFSSSSPPPPPFDMKIIDVCNEDIMSNPVPEHQVHGTTIILKEFCQTAPKEQLCITTPSGYMEITFIVPCFCFAEEDETFSLYEIFEPGFSSTPKSQGLAPFEPPAEGTVPGRPPPALPGTPPRPLAAGQHQGIRDAPETPTAQLKRHPSSAVSRRRPPPFPGRHPAGPNLAIPAATPFLPLPLLQSRPSDRCPARRLQLQPARRGPSSRPPSSRQFTLEEEDLLMGFNLFQSPGPPSPPRPSPQPLLAHRQEEGTEMVDLNAPTPAHHPSPDAVPTVPLPPARPRTRGIPEGCGHSNGIDRELILGALPSWLRELIGRREARSSSRALQHSAPHASGRSGRQPNQPATQRSNQRRRSRRPRQPRALQHSAPHASGRSGRQPNQPAPQRSNQGGRSRRPKQPRQPRSPKHPRTPRSPGRRHTWHYGRGRPQF